MQLERILQSQGFGSRKACRALIRAGVVAVGGRPCGDPFAEFAADGLAFSVAGESWHYRERVYLLLNKPAGYECSRSPSHHPGVYSLLPPPLAKREVQTVGRLDEDTTGLLLLSDDGDFIHHLISPRREVAKVYQVITNHPVDDGQIAALLAGVLLHGAVESVSALACVRVSDRLIHLTINEGKYHQVKRMLAAVGNRVAALRRIQVGGLRLPEDLAEGNWRWLEPTDMASLGYECGMGAPPLPVAEPAR